jgi:hypothetical protein
MLLQAFLIVALVVALVFLGLAWQQLRVLSQANLSPITNADRANLDFAKVREHYWAVYCQLSLRRTYLLLILVLLSVGRLPT